MTALRAVAPQARRGAGKGDARNACVRSGPFRAPRRRSSDRETPGRFASGPFSAPLRLCVISSVLLCASVSLWFSPWSFFVSLCLRGSAFLAMVPRNGYLEAWSASPEHLIRARTRRRARAWARARARARARVHPPRTRDPGAPRAASFRPGVHPFFATR